jgi:hypothetical protein
MPSRRLTRFGRINVNQVQHTLEGLTQWSNSSSTNQTQFQQQILYLSREHAIRLEQTPKLLESPAQIGDGANGPANPPSGPCQPVQANLIAENGGDGYDQMSLEAPWLRDTRKHRLANLQGMLVDSVCSQWCSCRCHRIASINSPQALCQWFGALSLGFSALPWRPTCNERSCQPRPSYSMRLSYRFPPWAMDRIICALMTSTPLTGPVMSLTTLRVIPDTEPVFLFAEKGNMSGIQSLFSKGLASIYDVDSAGQSLLDVKRTLPFPKSFC